MSAFNPCCRMRVSFMSDTGKQNISFLMDDALSTAEARFLLRRMQHEPGLVNVWSRYHLVRDCMQGQPAVLTSGSVAIRVMRQLQDSQLQNTSEPISARQQGGARRWLQLGAGGAIAASVATAALMLVQPITPPQNPMLSTAPVEVADAAIATTTTPESAAQDFSLLLGESRSPWLYVQPAAATRQQPLGYLNQSILYAQQPTWLHRGELPRAEAAPSRAGVYVLRGFGQRNPQREQRAPVETR